MIFIIAHARETYRPALDRSGAEYPRSGDYSINQLQMQRQEPSK
jgi:hypothetical protein